MITKNEIQSVLSLLLNANLLSHIFLPLRIYNYMYMLYTIAVFQITDHNFLVKKT